jgi:hypothetical protein
VLDNFISDIRMGIADADKQDYGESLTTKKDLIAKIKQKLQA